MTAPDPPLYQLSQNIAYLLTRHSSSCRKVFRLDAPGPGGELPHKRGGPTAGRHGAAGHGRAEGYDGSMTADAMRGRAPVLVSGWL
jgi:hypothetical protein